MSTEDKKTDNELIAEFMGETVYRDMDAVREVPISNLKAYWLLNQLKYDTSWNWLMPVVEKIETTSVKNRVWSIDGFFVRISRRHCAIEAINVNCLVSQSPYGIDQDSKISATYKIIIEFIKWYQAQPK